MCVQDILAFVTRLNESVRGKSYNAACPQSDGVRNVVAVLDTMASWIEEYPPVDQPQRYGNKVFRSYYARLQEVIFYNISCLFTFFLLKNKLV